MDWLTRLNSGPGRIPVGNGRIEFVHWAYESHLPDNLPHRHTYFEACLVGGHGAGTFTNLGTDHALRPGTLFLARPGAVHQIRNGQEPWMELFWVSFGWSSDEAPRTEADRLLRAFVDSDACVVPDEDGRVASLWTALRQVAGGPTVPEQVASLALSLVLGIAQALTPGHGVPLEEQRSENAAARLAVRYIQDNLNRPLSLAEIAAHVSLSERHFTRLFATYTGTSPARYVQLTRLDRANALLHGTDMPIKEIAQECGFTDVAYFTRCFAQRYGTPPAAHRRGEGHGRILQTSGALV